MEDMVYQLLKDVDGEVGNIIDKHNIKVEYNFAQLLFLKLKIWKRKKL